MKRAILTLHEKHNIEKNGLTFEYEIKVQVLKDLVELNHATWLDFFVLKVANNHFCFAQLFEKRSGISYIAG